MSIYKAYCTHLDFTNDATENYVIIMSIYKAYFTHLDFTNDGIVT